MQINNYKSDSFTDNLWAELSLIMALGSDPTGHCGAIPLTNSHT